MVVDPVDTGVQRSSSEHGWHATEDFGVGRRMIWSLVLVIDAKFVLTSI